jgi:hypothetical protein
MHQLSQILAVGRNFSVLPGYLEIAELRHNLSLSDWVVGFRGAQGELLMTTPTSCWQSEARGTEHL